jgi:hypothetical protein
MKIIISSLLFTAIIYLVKSFFKEDHSFKGYLMIFIVYILGLTIIDAYCEIKIPSVSMYFTGDEVEDLIDKIEYHEAEGEKLFKCAKESCWYLPECSDKDKAKYCFQSLIATFPACTPMSKIVSAFLAFMAQYGMDCMDQWHKIQTLLMEAKYHYEMKEFYEEVLVKG